MGCVQEWPYVQHPQATPAYIFLHVYNYWTSLNQSECIHNAKLNHSYPNGQFLQHHMQGYVCRCGLRMLDIWLSLNTPHHTLSPYFFYQFIPTFYLIFSKNFNVLVCLLFWWPLAILFYFIYCHQYQHSFLHLHSFVYLVFHFRHTTKNQRGKPPA